MRPVPDLAQQANQHRLRRLRPRGEQSCAPALLQTPREHHPPAVPALVGRYKKPEQHRQHGAVATRPDAPAAAQSPAPISDCEMTVDCSTADSVRPAWATPVPECTDTAPCEQY